ncbi:uncharacterized protein [Misgurnus anguillicaudatus]|uniref:uncharacterized protein isoform X5 n=1 Tax=Misgurnus anguillicaudatus TaxID=75329 RepID=UPI003CCF9865
MKKLLTIMGIPLGLGVQYANFGNDNIHKDTDKERCARTTYFIGGNKICKNSFLFLMGNCVMRYRWPWMNPFEGPFSSGKEKELCDEISVAVDESIEGPSTSGKEKMPCKNKQCQWPRKKFQLLMKMKCAIMKFIVQ